MAIKVMKKVVRVAVTFVQNAWKPKKWKQSLMPLRTATANRARSMKRELFLIDD